MRSNPNATGGSYAQTLRNIFNSKPNMGINRPSAPIPPAPTPNYYRGSTPGGYTPLGRGLGYFTPSRPMEGPIAGYKPAPNGVGGGGRRLDVRSLDGSANNSANSNTDAIMAFQRSHGLTVDGIAGPITRAAGWDRPNANYGGFTKSAAMYPYPSIYAGPPPGNNKTAVNPHPSGAPMIVGRGSAISPGAFTNNNGRGMPNSASNQMASPVDDYAKRAALAVGTEINPQEAAMRATATASDARFNHDQGIATADTNAAVAKQGSIYSGLNTALNGQLPVAASNFDNQATGTAQNFTNYQNTLSSTFNDARQQTTNEANRLDLGAALPQATVGINSDQSFLKGLGANNAAQAQSSIGQDKGLAISNMLSQIGSSRREGADLQGSTIGNFNKISDQAKYDQGAKVTDILAQLNALEGTRAGKIYEATQSLKSTAAQQALAAKQQAFDNMIASGGLDVKQQLASGAVGLDNARANAATSNAQTSRTTANSNASLNAAKEAVARAGLDPNSLPGQAEVARIAKDTAAANSAQRNYPTGDLGVQSYLNTMLSHPEDKAAVNFVVRSVMRGSNPAKDYPSAIAQANRIIDQKGYPASIQDYMLAAIGIYWGKNTGKAKP